MAFPATSVLDSGAGADGNLTTGNWLDGTGFGDHSLVRASNKFTGGPLGAREGTSAWVTSFGPDCEVFATIDTISTTLTKGGAFGLRWNNATATTHGYYFFWDSGNGGAGIFDAVSFAGLLALPSLVVAPGDQLGFRAVGNVLTAWQNGVQIGTVTDSSHTGAGLLALDIGDQIVTEHNFGGGTMPVAVTTPVKAIVAPIAAVQRASNW